MGEDERRWAARLRAFEVHRTVCPSFTKASRPVGHCASCPCTRLRTCERYQSETSGAHRHEHGVGWICSRPQPPNQGSKPNPKANAPPADFFRPRRPHSLKPAPKQQGGQQADREAGRQHCVRRVHSQSLGVHGCQGMPRHGCRSETWIAHGLPFWVAADPGATPAASFCTGGRAHEGLVPESAQSSASVEAFGCRSSAPDRPA